MVTVYVNDLIVFARTNERPAQVEHQLRSKFEIENFGTLK